MCGVCYLQSRGPPLHYWSSWSTTLLQLLTFIKRCWRWKQWEWLSPSRLELIDNSFHDFLRLLDCNATLFRYMCFWFEFSRWNISVQDPMSTVFARSSGLIHSNLMELRKCIQIDRIKETSYDTPAVGSNCSGWRLVIYHSWARSKIRC